MSFLALRFRAYVGLLLLSLSVSAWAEGASRGVFWEVRSETATVYLLGSIHVARPSLYPLSGAIEKAFERSSVLVVEVSQADMQTENFQQLLRTRGFYQDGKTLLDDIGAETYELLQVFLRQHELPTAPFLRMKPGMVAMSLASLQVQAMGFSSEMGIDRHFERRASEDKMIDSLETAEQQLDLIADMPNANALLKYSLLDMQQAEQMIEQLFQAWRDGDTNKLEELTLTPYEQESEFQPILEKVFYERNRQMTERIEQYLAGDKTCFVVVGAGHLLGERGIVELLNRQHFSVRRR